jgi:hypothetical protein
MPIITRAPEFNTLAATITALKSLKPRHTLERDLASAQRAEHFFTPSFRKDHEYSSLLHATHGPQIEDGMYVCCCGADNTIVHFTGPHPFKHLNCRVCNHTFCNACTSSEILTPIHAAKLHPYAAHLATTNHLGQICADCGLSHRAIDRSLQCPCGSTASADWILFAILSPDKYKYDPNAAFVHLKLGRATNAVEQMAGREVQQLRYFDVPVKVETTCTLKRRGAIRRKVV